LNWEIVTAVSELVAALTVVLSLVYLAREVRDNSSQTKTNTQSNLVALCLDGFTPIFNSADNTEIWDKGLSNPDELSPKDLRTFCTLMDRNFFVFDNLISLFYEGHLDIDRFESITGYYVFMYNSPGGQKWAEKGNYKLTEEAVNHLIEMS